MSNFKSGGYFKLVYDYGTTTTVLMKVISLQSSSEISRSYPRLEYNSLTGNSGLSDVNKQVILPFTREYVEAVAHGENIDRRFISPDKQQELLQSIDAYRIGTRRKLDEIFPHFAKVVISGRYESFCLGLQYMFTSKKDGICCAIQGYPNDLMFSNEAFTSMDEFLITADHAWNLLYLKKDLSRYREGWITRTVFPVAVMDEKYYR